MTDMHQLIARHGEARDWLTAFLKREDHPETCELWPYGVSSGYAQMYVGNGVKKKVTRVVLETFIGPPPGPGRMVAAHSCHTPRCVNPHHLRWATYRENSDDRLADGTHTSGERHPFATITNDQARAIYALKGKLRRREIAARFGCSLNVVAHIHAGERWADITGAKSRAAGGVS